MEEITFYLAARNVSVFLPAGTSCFFTYLRPRVIIMIDMAKPNLNYEHLDRLIKDVKKDRTLCKKLEENKLTEDEIKESE